MICKAVLTRNIALTGIKAGTIVDIYAFVKDNSTAYAICYAESFASFWEIDLNHLKPIK